MHDYGRRDRLVVAYAQGVVRWRWAVLVASLVVAGLATSGLRHLQFIADYRYYFSPENPNLRAFDRLQNTYTKMDNILFVVAPREGDVFDAGVLEEILWLTEQSWQIPHSIRVDSLSNFQHSWAEEDDLTVEDLVAGATALDAAELERIRDVALHEPLLARKLVAADGRATAVNVTIQVPEGSALAGAESVAHAREILGALRDRGAAVDVALTGNVLLSDAFGESMARDIRTLVPWMYVALIAAMLLFLRSVSGTIAVLSVTALSVVTAVGMAGWLGIPISPPAATSPTIILTIAIADGIHILVTLTRDMRQGQSKTEALIDSLRINWQPVFLTSLTTIIGFLCFRFSVMMAYRDLGMITAMGVAAAWFYSVTFLPAFVSLAPYRVRPARRLRRLSMENFAEWLVRHRSRILPSTVVVALAATALIPRLDLNDSFVEYFDESIQFRRDTDFTTEKLSGIYQAHYSLDAGAEAAVNEPDYLHAVEAFETWLRGQPEVDHVSALPQTMKRLNKNMHGDDAAFYRLPESRELAAQYLLLYEMSLPYGLDLNNQINVKKSATKVTATLKNISSAELRRFDARAQAWLATHPVTEQSQGASLALMFAHIGLLNVQAMLFGTALAFALISLLLMLELRSLRLGLLSLIPNLVPTLMAFGVWSLLVGEVGAALGVITAASLGIIVDATVHFLSKYLRARRERDASPEDAVRYAVSTVGSALWISFLILVAGFAVLSQSTFKVNAEFGLLISITIGAALLADFLLLPTLLMWVDRRATEDGGTMHRKSAAALAVAAALLVAGVPSAHAETPEEKGLAIAMEGDRRDHGFINSTSTLKMVLANKQGETSERELRSRVLEVPEMDEGDKSLIVFDTPRDVKGTAFLSFTHITEPDDQWLYLPSLKRVKRISSKNKSGPFMGSEFAYEDMSSQEVAKYTYKWLRDEPCGEYTCFVVERYPVYENSGYTRQIVWADQEEYRILKTEYYDRKDALLKTLVLSDYHRYLDKHWRAHDLYMENHQTGKTTRLTWSEFQFQIDIDENDFDKNALKRAR